MSIILLVLAAGGMAAILIYVFRMRKLPIYKMQEKTFFNMIYDGFRQEERFELLFFIFYFMKRIFYAMLLAFLST
jgi:hypothetical protein